MGESKDISRLGWPHRAIRLTMALLPVVVGVSGCLSVDGAAQPPGASDPTQPVPGTTPIATRSASPSPTGQAPASASPSSSGPTETPTQAAAPVTSATFAPDASGIGAQHAPAEPSDDAPAVEAAAGADLTKVLTQAANEAKGVRLAAGATYRLTTALDLPDSVPFFDGNGATIDVAIAGATRERPASAFIIEQGTTDTAVTDLTLNLNHAAHTRGVLISSTSKVRISGLTIINSVYRGIETVASTGPVADVLIADNVVRSPEGTAENKGEVYSILSSTALANPDSRFASSRSPIWERYATDGTISPTKYDHKNMSVVGNNIDGGYYGISLSGVTNSVVKNNVSTNNMRSISMQNSTSGNLVEGNRLSQSKSSSIHLAYGSSSNTIKNNTIVTTVAKGQGLLQSYTNSDNNSFTGNSVTAFGSQPGWILYVGPDSDNVVFRDNTVSGNARKAFIGIESVWDHTSATSSGPNAASYMSSKVPASTDGTPLIYNGGSGPLEKVTITDNVLHPGDKTAPLVYIGAEVSTGLKNNKRIVGSITGVSIKDNTVLGSGYSKAVSVHEGSRPGIGTAKVSISDDSVGHYAKGDPAKAGEVLYTSGTARGDGSVVLVGSTDAHLTGGPGDDALTGNAGSNTIDGAAGNDTIDPGSGADTLTGGAGADTFAVGTFLDGSVDTITDFRSGEDKIALSPTVFGRLRGDWFSSDEVTSATRVYQRETRLYFDADGSGSASKPVAFAAVAAGVRVSPADFILLG